jgi:hypothetical protein
VHRPLDVPTVRQNLTIHLSKKNPAACFDPTSAVREFRQRLADDVERQSLAG